MKLRVINKNIKNIKDKKVFLRVDFNVPIENGKIKDDGKIAAALPTIRFLLRYGCSLIIATHLGRPRGRDKKYSTQVVARRLSKLLGGKRVEFASGLSSSAIITKATGLKTGKILFLENLRFDKGEEKNSNKLARALASMAEIYVNDAFSVSHRKHASVSAIRKYLPSYCGLLMDLEIRNLDRVKQPQKPLVLIVGGAKIKTKISLIKNFKNKASKILIGGALANNFFKAQGLKIGKSLIDKESIRIAKGLTDKKIILPVDVIVDSKGRALVRDIKDISQNDRILDIGPKTIKLFSSYIKEAATVVWNGPLGMFEENDFKHGTLSIAIAVATRAKGRAFGVVGGGETIETLKISKVESHLDWISTGGGAMLAYLGGEDMPGL